MLTAISEVTSAQHNFQKKSHLLISSEKKKKFPKRFPDVVQVQWVKHLNAVAQGAAEMWI